MGLFPGVSGLYFGRFGGGLRGFRASQLVFWVFWGVFQSGIFGCSRAIFWGVSGQFGGVSALFEGGNLGCFRVTFWDAVTAFWAISACSRATFGGVLRHLGHCRNVVGCWAIGECSGASQQHFGVFLWGIGAAFGGIFRVFLGNVSGQHLGVFPHGILRCFGVSGEYFGAFLSFLEWGLGTTF